MSATSPARRRVPSTKYAQLRRSCRLLKVVIVSNPLESRSDANTSGAATLSGPTTIRLSMGSSTSPLSFALAMATKSSTLSVIAPKHRSAACRAPLSDPAAASSWCANRASSGYRNVWMLRATFERRSRDRSSMVGEQTIGIIRPPNSRL